MQLDDLIEEYTVEGIAKRTNITEEVISRLFNKEFKTLKKTQALGAISIIEREYDVDLGSLRQECKAYFGESDTLDGGLTVLKPISKEKRFMPKLLSLTLLILLAFGAWYFFTEYYNQKIDPYSSQETKPLANVMLKHQDTAPEEENESSIKNRITKSESMPEERSIEESIRDIIEGNNSASKTAEAVVEENSKQVPEQDSEETASQTVENSTEEVVEVNQSTQIEDAGAASIEIEGNTTTVLPEEDIETEQNSSLESTPVIVRESITLLPMKKMWFRLINYDTKRARSFKRKDRYEIDLRKHAWLLATENAHFAIIDKDLFEEYQAEGKLFFLFDQDGIHQLSEKEYRAVEK